MKIHVAVSGTREDPIKTVTFEGQDLAMTADEGRGILLISEWDATGRTIAVFAEWMHAWKDPDDDAEAATSVRVTTSRYSGERGHTDIETVVAGHHLDVQGRTLYDQDHVGYNILTVFNERGQLTALFRNWKMAELVRPSAGGMSADAVGDGGDATSAHVDQ